MATVQALLLKTGEFPDMGVRVTTDVLDMLVRNFMPVPVLLEHIETPFRLGEVVRVWREGDTLYGELSLYDEAKALLDRWGLKSLSVGLTGNLTRLLEVSVTATPRVKEARLLNSRYAMPLWDDIEFAEGWRPNRDPFRFPIEAERAWDADGTEQAWRAWVSEKDPSEWGAAEWRRYRRRFLAYDADNPEKFASYKLPVVAIVEGEPHLFRRALIAAKAAIAGARGGVDLPEGVKEQIAKWIDEVLSEKQASHFVYEGGEVLAMSKTTLEPQAVLDAPDTPQEPPTHTVPEAAVDAHELEALRAEVNRLRFAQREAQAREKARAWREQGLITPAQEPLVVSLLCAETDTLRFSVEGSELRFDELLQRLIELNPRFPVGQSLPAETPNPSRFAKFGLSPEGMKLAQLFAEGRDTEAYALFNKMIGGE